MIQLFLKTFMKKQDLPQKEKVGISCSACGIILNLFQFIIKMIVGSISGSIAVTADAVHNLSDMGSSVITLLSFVLPVTKFKLLGKKTEYIAGLIISLMLLITAIQTAKSSILKIITPEPLVFSLFSVVMLLFSILVKIYMASYYRHYGNMVNSQALKVTAVDCLCDSISTIIAAGAIVAARFTQWNIDGFGGVAVSAFILIASCKAGKDSVKEMLKS